jgi:DNA-binding beta-propeller fold protein YncE
MISVPVNAAKGEVPRSEKLRPALIAVAGMALVLVALVAGKQASSAALLKSENVLVPKLEYDASWPKPLPNANWVVGPVSGLSIDKSDDTVWVLHRGREVAYALTEEGKALSAPAMCALGPCTGLGLISCTERCGESDWTPAPFVMVFDKEGNLIDTPIGPDKLPEGVDWPYNPHTIHVSDDGYVYVSGGLPTPHEFEFPVEQTHDSYILKFTKAGEFVAQFGKPYECTGTNDPVNFNRPCAHVVRDGELYVADGHGNVRITVHDPTTGEQIRQWGGYGLEPDISLPTEERYGRTVHGVEVANDGMVYVCDRDRGLLHVHEKDGTWLREVSIPEFIATSMATSGIDYTPGLIASGFPGPWAVAFSTDPAQKFMYISSPDQMIITLERKTLELLTTAGDMGMTPGSFMGMHAVQTNSDGDVFVSEIQHGRVQKFKNTGIVSATRAAHVSLTPEESYPKSGLEVGARYMLTFAFFQMLLHPGCPQVNPATGHVIPDVAWEPANMCGPNSWLW